jgi:pimeloyl-ACP methyl ester carboxylesterase
MYTDLMGYASTVDSLLTEGFAVAFTDYQGLGHTGVHPYLEPRTAAFNVIDAVRALRAQFPDISARWLAVGESQGGQASWAANEYASNYGAGLNLVGSIALKPAADMSGLATAAANGTLTDGQIALMPSVVAGLERIDPTLVESDYLRGAASQYKQVFMSCAPESDKEPLYAELDAEQVQPISLIATIRLLGLLRANALPQRPLSAPLLVVNGSADELIPSQWVTAAVSHACSLGGIVMHIELNGRGHNDVDFGESEYRWAHDRFAGEPAPSNCDRHD